MSEIYFFTSKTMDENVLSCKSMFSVMNPKDFKREFLNNLGSENTIFPSLIKNYIAKK